MDQEFVRNPYFASAPPSHPPENHLHHPPTTPSAPYLLDPFTPDDQGLAFALSRLNLSSQQNNFLPSYGSFVDNIMGQERFLNTNNVDFLRAQNVFVDNVMGQERLCNNNNVDFFRAQNGFVDNIMGQERLLNNNNMGVLMAQNGFVDNIMGQERLCNNNNVGFLRAQNGGFSPDEKIVGLFGGPGGDFLVGPGPVMNNFGGGSDFIWSSYEAASRLNFDGVAQRDYGYGYNQYGPGYDSFLQTKLRKSYPHFPILSQNNCHVQQTMDSLDNSNNFKAKLNNVKQMIQLKQQNGMFSMGDFRGRLVSLAKDQNWSKILQMKIAEQNIEENEFVLSEVIGSLTDLLKNQFGSYFVQKIFLHCNEEQRTRIIVAVTSVPYQLVSVCLCSHGAKAVQIILENLSTPQQISLVMSALSAGTVLLAVDTYGHHVIEYCVESFPFEYSKHLLNEVAENCLRISTDKSGCCVLQSCVKHSHGECRERLIKEIIANSIHIVEDPFGNYVVQHLLALGEPKITAALTRRLRGHFAILSCNKFASNVVEKFLVEGGEEHATTILKELLASPNDVVKLLVDPYGNFVIQSALEVSKEMPGQFFHKLFELIVVNAPSIKSNIRYVTFVSTAVRSPVDCKLDAGVSEQL
ncbi:hypothetical protein Leryth_017149 [Lithospermum erythrorhizon]|uniref:RNA metabolism protein n=1 Tax=Lithospermum erythrorhizon TaxID=34254 RepID=A0AAV3RY15_LITER|nr:hypothetical protein Leryth_017149 [Lithospermum erythrorhizon]